MNLLFLKGLSIYMLVFVKKFFYQIKYFAFKSTVITLFIETNTEI